MTRSLLALVLLTLPACATVRVGSIQRSHGPQVRGRQVSLTLTKELP